MIEIAVYGAGGFGREVAWLVDSCNVAEKVYDLVCFIDDDESVRGQLLNGLPVFPLDEAFRRFPRAAIVAGIGSPKTRQMLMEKAAEVGFSFETVIHPEVKRSSWVEVGYGVVICAGTAITTNVVIRNHVQINLHCTIGHDVVMGEYTTLAPGVHVSGFVHFGERAYVGTGAVIVNGTKDSPIFVGDDATIGAGACVTKSVPSGTTVVGVPAKSI